MGRSLARCSLLVIALTVGAGRQALAHTDAVRQPTAFDPIPIANPAGELLLLGVTINGQTQDRPAVFLRNPGGLNARIADLRAWRIRAAGAPVTSFEGQLFARLSALPGVKVDVDESAQILRLTIDPDMFDASVIDATPNAILRTPSEPILAGFINYDLSADWSDGDVRTNGFVETGLSDRWGVVSNTMTFGDTGAGSRATRLDTYYLHDDPVRLTRFVAGDTLTSATEWSRPIRYGGLRYGTDFGLQPGLLTFPTPSFTGRTSLPSNVELYVNDALRFQGNVDQGPFSVNQAPLVTGAGQVTVVVRDALGVERRVTTSYYVSSRLLRPGLSDYSVEAGAERRGYGVDSFDYGDAFVSGSYRRGINDLLTVETRAEASGKVQNIGGGVATVWPAVGEFGLAVAASNGPDGSGGMVRGYFSRISNRWNVSLTYQRATDSFAQIGVNQPNEQIRQLIAASAGLSLGRYGTVSAAWTELTLGDDSRTRVSSISYSVPIGERIFLNLFALRAGSRGEEAATTFGLGLTIPFGSRSSAFLQADSNNTMAEYRRNPPTDQGWGYRLTASQGDFNRQEAEVTWRGQPGQLTGQVAHTDDGYAGRVLASGGIIIAGGGVHPSRRVDGGFALIEVPGEKDVRIYQENRLIGRTDGAGRLIIPNLQPYDNNRVSLAAADLPLDARMDGDTLNVVPRYFGGVRARFQVSQDHPATVIIRLPDGHPLEVGAPVIIKGSPVTAFAGYGGEVFVADLKDGAVLEADRTEGVCRVVLGAVPAGVLPSIGPVVCQPVEAPR